MILHTDGRWSIRVCESHLFPDTPCVAVWYGDRRTDYEYQTIDDAVRQLPLVKLVYPKAYQTECV